MRNWFENAGHKRARLAIGIYPPVENSDLDLQAVHTFRPDIIKP